MGTTRENADARLTGFIRCTSIPIDGNGSGDGRLARSTSSIGVGCHRPDGMGTEPGGRARRAGRYRDLARRSGITTPTVYAYFDSKNTIFDAMFGQAATEFADRQAEPYADADPRDRLLASTHRFFEFCSNDPSRYQLLFQRTLPGFEPSASSYEPAVRALAAAGEMLAACGVTDAHHLDLWTGLIEKKGWSTSSCQRSRGRPLGTPSRRVCRHVPHPLRSVNDGPPGATRRMTP